MNIDRNSDSGRRMWWLETYDSDLQVGGEATEDGALGRSLLALGCLGRHGVTRAAAGWRRWRSLVNLLQKTPSLLRYGTFALSDGASRSVSRETLTPAWAALAPVRKNRETCKSNRKALTSTAGRWRRWGWTATPGRTRISGFYFCFLFLKKAREPALRGEPAALGFVLSSRGQKTYESGWAYHRGSYLKLVWFLNEMEFFVTLKWRCGRYLVDEWQRIILCTRTKVQLSSLECCAKRGRSCRIVWLPMRTFAFFLSRWCRTISKGMISTVVILVFKG